MTSLASAAAALDAALDRAFTATESTSETPLPKLHSLLDGLDASAYASPVREAARLCSLRAAAANAREAELRASAAAARVALEHERAESSLHAQLCASQLLLLQLRTAPPLSEHAEPSASAVRAAEAVPLPVRPQSVEPEELPASSARTAATRGGLLARARRRRALDSDSD